MSDLEPQVDPSRASAAPAGGVFAREHDVPTRGALRLPDHLRADCSQCAGLCCIAHAFYAIQGFGYDKPALVPCRHLTHEDRCAIHADRTGMGFSGCVEFDCLGAGQRVTRRLLGKAKRRAVHTSIAHDVLATYTEVLALHRAMATLALVEPALAPPLDAEARRRQSTLDRICATRVSEGTPIAAETLRDDALEFARRALEATPASPLYATPRNRLGARANTPMAGNAVIHMAGCEREAKDAS